MKKQDLSHFIGKKQNLLTVIDIIVPQNGRKKLLCKCDCGNYTEILPYQFTSENIKSCGCLKHRTPYNATHKLSQTPLYHIWETMRLRCHNPNNKKYYSYGARGIYVCEEWRNNFLSFQEWALSNGYKKGLSIDRIDNNKGYYPDNCRWATIKEQQRNTRRNIMITIDNETKSLIEWCEIYNLPYKTICNRIANGWDKHKALFYPIKRRI